MILYYITQCYSVILWLCPRGAKAAHRTSTSDPGLLSRSMLSGGCGFESHRGRTFFDVLFVSVVSVSPQWDAHFCTFLFFLSGSSNTEQGYIQYSTQARVVSRSQTVPRPISDKGNGLD